MDDFARIKDHEALCDQVDDIIRTLESQSDTNNALQASLEAINKFNDKVVSATKTIHHSCIARDNALAVVAVSLSRIIIKCGIEWTDVYDEILKSKSLLPSDTTDEASKLVDTIAHTLKKMECGS